MPKHLSRLFAIFTPKREWFQFRLRSLFYLTAFVATICFWVALSNRAKRQRNAIAAVKLAARSIIYDRASPTERFMRRLMPTDYGDTAEIITFESMDAAILPQLHQLPRLRIIRIVGYNVTDAQIAKLKSLSTLQEITLKDCPRVTDAAMAELQKALPNCRIVR